MIGQYGLSLVPSSQIHKFSKMRKSMSSFIAPHLFKNWRILCAKLGYCQTVKLKLFAKKRLWPFLGEFDLESNCATLTTPLLLLLRLLRFRAFLLFLFLLRMSLSPSFIITRIVRTTAATVLWRNVRIFRQQLIFFHQRAHLLRNVVHSTQSWCCFFCVGWVGGVVNWSCWGQQVSLLKYRIRLCGRSSPSVVQQQHPAVAVRSDHLLLVNLRLQHHWPAAGGSAVGGRSSRSLPELQPPGAHGFMIDPLLLQQFHKIMNNSWISLKLENRERNVAQVCDEELKGLA